MRNVQVIALSVALFFNLSLSASASEPAQQEDEQWFQADLVVFRYLNNDSGEAWPGVSHHMLPADAVSLRDPDSSAAQNTPLFELSETTEQLASNLDIARDSYVSLPASEMMLNKQAATLHESSNYQIITQQAWRMPVSAETEGQPVQIRAVISGQDSYLLDGTVSVSRERFIHVDIDFWLNKLGPESLYSSISGQQYSDEPSVSDLLNANRGSDNLIRLHEGSPPLVVTENFQIQQRRRIRNTNEIQYIDSPVVGVLFKLTPYQRPATLVETGMTISVANQ